MARGTAIKVTGVRELQKKFGKLAAKVIKEADMEMASAANDYANRSIAKAPRDQSQIIQGIHPSKVGILHHETVSSAPHSAYMEFGTKRKAKIPSDLQEMAAQFEGTGNGGGKGFYDSILAWVKRKGIGAERTKSGRVARSKNSQLAQEQAAFAIYRSILINGVNPHPFFFEHRAVVKENLMKALTEKTREAIR